MPMDKPSTSTMITTNKSTYKMTKKLSKAVESQHIVKINYSKKPLFNKNPETSKTLAQSQVKASYPINQNQIKNPPNS